MADGEGEPRVYDIRKAKLQIIQDYPGVNTGDGEVTGIGEDGYGITPQSEVTCITGLTGEHGFNMDPSTMAEATISLQSTSDWNDILRQMYNQQQIAPLDFQMTIEVSEEFQSAYGFSKKGLTHCMIVAPPEHATDGKESPQYEWKIVGYGYFEEAPGVASAGLA